MKIPFDIGKFTYGNHQKATGNGKEHAIDDGSVNEFYGNQCRSNHRNNANQEKERNLIIIFCDRQVEHGIKGYAQCDKSNKAGKCV